jgi:hypothetical protein
LVGFGVLQQQINLIRRFFSNVQTPDSVITPKNNRPTFSIVSRMFEATAMMGAAFSALALAGARIANDN